nr:aspartic proteinase cdr1 [Quercus suber]
MASTVMFHPCFLVASILSNYFIGLLATAASNGGFTVELIRPDFPKSPFYNANKTFTGHLNKYYPNALQSRVTACKGQHLMKVSIGTPPIDIYGIADTGQTVSLDIALGCGQNSSGVFNDQEMGIIALGGGPVSFVSQIGSTFGSKRFPIACCHMEHHQRLCHKIYMINLAVEVLKQIAMNPIRDDPDLGTQLCYRTKSNLDGPILIVHFEGANVQLKPMHTFISPKDGVYYFAMQGSNGGGIYGNFAQANFLIGFDMETMMLSFMPTDCTKQ